MKIIDYINLYFDGNKSGFAKKMNVIPQQVTKWVNDDWIIVDGKIYSPKRELSSGDIMQRIMYLAKVFGGAEFALAEIKELQIQGQQANDITKNAKKMIDLLSDSFKNENYHIYMIGYDNQAQKYSIYSEQPLYDLGAAYFHIMNPGSLLFAFNNDLKSENTFEIGRDPSRLTANRFDPYGFAILFNEVQKALSQQ